MTNRAVYPKLEEWEATKSTLHAYSKVVGAVPRAHAIFHPKWWHISLKVVPDGLVTENMELPDGGIFNVKMDFHHHVIVLTNSKGEIQSWSMAGGLTSNQLAEKLLDAVAGLGLRGDYMRQKFENDDPREYDSKAAQTYFSALVNVEQVFEQHRAKLSGEVGPVQLWPHGFDLSFEWIGTRMIEFEEHGQTSSFPSQINLGFSPGEPSHPAPYFYSNPFPFEGEKWLSQALPHGARWFTESWKGSLFEYNAVVNDPEANQKVLDYAQAVYKIASPGLMA